MRENVLDRGCSSSRISCSTSGQTCSSSPVVRPQSCKINVLGQDEDEHVRPLVRPLFVLFSRFTTETYLLLRTNNGTPHTTYGRAGLGAEPPIRDVRARGPPFSFVSASPDHCGQNDRR